MFYSFEDFIPVVDPSAYVHPQANVTGNVIIGRDVYIGPGACLRGDWGGINIQDGCNVQENCVVHMFPGIAIEMEEGAHIGHGAIIHGAHVGRNVLVGMNAVIMDESRIGANSIIGALAFIKAKTDIPDRSLVVGNPARVIRQVSDEMLNWKTKGTRLYQQLPGMMKKDSAPCEPLTEVPPNRPKQRKVYEVFRKGGDG